MDQRKKRSICTLLLAGKGYSTAETVELAQKLGMEVVIHRKRHRRQKRKRDRAKRHLVNGLATTQAKLVSS